MKTKTAVCFALPLVLASSWSLASNLEQLDDDQLSEVIGQDGVYLNLKNFSLNSASLLGNVPLTLTYTMPYEGDPLHQDTDPGDPFFKDPSKPVSYIQKGGISISRTDPVNPDDIFNDPFQIQVESLIVPGDIALPALADDDPLKTERKQEVIRLLNPKNLAGEMKWNVAYDWKVATEVTSSSTGKVHDMGAYVIKDMAYFGGGLALAPAWSYKNKDDVRGAAFGLDVNIEIAALMLRPRGRADDGTELNLTGIKIGAANSTLTGVDPDRTKTWKVADVITQPGIINAITTTDSNGVTSTVLHMGIEWYRGSDETQIPTGAISVDNISIKNGPASAPTVTNFGGASIGGIQIRYLDVVFRNPY